jgi:hypothetical protein
MLRLVAGSQFVLEADDHRIITFSTRDDTKVQKDGKTIDLKALAVADHLTVDSTADEDGYFTATTVVFNLAGTAGDREAASRTWDLPTLAERKAAARASGTAGSNRNPSGAGDRDDDDRPVLRRSPSTTPSTSPSTTPSTSPSTSPSASPSTNDTAQASSGTAANPPEQSGAPPANGANSPPPAQPQDVADGRPTTELRPNDPPPDADDPGRPELRRGRPPARPRAASSDDDASASPSAPATVATVSAGAPSVGPVSGPPKFADAVPGVIRIEEDPVIVKAKGAAAEYASTLPDFFCRQVTTRYETDDPKSGWQALDTVTADLAYQNGRESYQNIKVGNKAMNTGMDQIPGSSSSGEFASILQDLFEPSTAASFRKGGQDTLRGRASTTFKFEVKRENSHWRVTTGGQLYYPAYRGTVWIDRGTSRVTRIEMESRNMPILFPFEKVETAVDYDFVRLSTPQEFLMPVEAEVLSCEESSSRCLRNRIEFRNYRKFGADSDITFGN